MAQGGIDARMRQYEAPLDPRAPSDAFIVVRLDGRSFTRMTAEAGFAKPFDASFHAHMRAAARHVMTSGLTMLYATTHSDEISVLLSPKAEAFGRRALKLASVLAGEASAAFSLAMGAAAAFDGRVAALPDVGTVGAYFRWRADDGRRNALSACCFWRLRAEGLSAAAAEAQLSGLSSDAKRVLLAERGAPFEALPDWARAGSVLSWERREKTGVNPLTGEVATALRRRLVERAPAPEGAAAATRAIDILRTELDAQS